MFTTAYIKVRTEHDCVLHKSQRGLCAEDRGSTYSTAAREAARYIKIWIYGCLSFRVIDLRRISDDSYSSSVCLLHADDAKKKP